MKSIPTNFEELDLSADERKFARNVLSNKQFGFLLLKVNPTLRDDKVYMHALVCSDGVLFFRFFDEKTPEDFVSTVSLEISESFRLYQKSEKKIIKKLQENKQLTSGDKKLRFPINLLYVFPGLTREKTEIVEEPALQSFTKQHCIFKEDLADVRNNLDFSLKMYLKDPSTNIGQPQMTFSDSNVDAVIQKIVPAYVIVKPSDMEVPETKEGAPEESLLITKDNEVAKVFRMDDNLINIVNEIKKGEQLILACAGAGKSELLIAKCFRAAEMNPDKRFLITCFNRPLAALYKWRIQKAGLKGKNVECLTFHALCRKLKKANGGSFSSAGKSKNVYDDWVCDAINLLHKGSIPNRYYGIFIDEVQQFSSEWYKFCYDLLEHKETDDHLFVICGDLSQKLENLQESGQGPWQNAGQGYPDGERLDRKSIRLEKNLRNCIEINEFVTRFVSAAKEFLSKIQGPDAELNSDIFFLGKSSFHKPGVKIKQLKNKANEAEAEMIVESIKTIHDMDNIPYDQIAVIAYNWKYKLKFHGWSDSLYDLKTPLLDLLEQENILFQEIDSQHYNGQWYMNKNSVKLVSLKSSLGLDFKAVIVCGLLPMGVKDKTKKIRDPEAVKDDSEKLEKCLSDVNSNIKSLYVAFTRARDILHIILPESGEKSVYIKMIEDANNETIEKEN